MATPRKKTEPTKQQLADALIIDKASFKMKLGEILKSGKELLNRSITNVDELERNQKDFYGWEDYNSEYLKQAFNNENNQYKRTYDDTNKFYGLFGNSDNSPNEKLKQLKEKISNKVTFLERLFDKVDLLKSDVEEALIVKSTKTVHSSNKNIFIVHGHNMAVQQSVARNLEKLGLNPIILSEQPNAGNTVIEKFEANSDVGFAVILLTDDDEGKSKTEIDLKSRARQNVVLELGYFIGRLGRKRVLPLYTENVELPSDIHGLLYIPIDKADTWKFALVRELKKAGYDVDANSIL
ncbi:putative nucleotide-binding protein with TIR-like domain [Flavobacterium limicola]|uniref:Putative nucleotide-binding protein with TIR-like domain n=1 Tax=Flavobacterium limicola TaxID=180441 RepID=A0A495S4Y3_9FLAO|nr:nucleotide-binding protein [Flavobacterium limicola]RKS94897.1 putative nucleotide-binding protein with TIR-like domain [Flavobacterium limicola]